PESRFPGQFFLLRRDELAIGLAKTRSLLAKTHLPGDRSLALQTTVDTDGLRPNTRTGLGRFIESDEIVIDGLHFLDDNLTLTPVRVEEAYAESLRVLTPTLKPFEELTPRSVSILPVALGCQAACPFCYSKASASAEQAARPIDMVRVRRVLAEGRRRG